MSKEKLMLVSWKGANDTGGVERVTQYMVQAWKDQFEVEVVDFASIKRTWFYKKVLGRHYVLDAIMVSLYIRRKILGKRDQYKIVVQGFNAPFVKADIAFAHGTMRGLKTAVEGKNPKWHFNQYFEKLSMKRAKKVVAVAEHVRKEVNELYKVENSKITVLENCVDTDTFYPLNPKDKARDSDANITILFCGRLEYGKGVDKLLKLADHIEKLNGFHLIIATPDNTNIELFEYLEKTEIRIGLSKEQTNIFYNEGDVVYFPSYYEGFGLVAIECLSSGVPIIGNDVGEISDLYSRHQEGVKLLNENEEENLLMMGKLAGEFREYSAKIRLHNAMIEKYSLKLYEEKLRRLWSDQ